MKYFEQTMRWFGPQDTVPLAYIRQSGATGVVTALHHIDIGEIWTKEQILERKHYLEKAGLHWSVVESVNVHESIKIADRNRDQFIDQYRQTITNLAECGIKTICYNFMPVLDWSRTDLVYRMPDGSKALRFERIALVAFDLFILKRKNAEKEYSAPDIERAKTYFDLLSNDERKVLQANATMGIPGYANGFSLDEMRDRLATYEHIDDVVLRKNLKYFLENVIDIAEDHDVKLTIHPDDPPFPLLGLPRIVSTEADVLEIVTAVASSANGLCFCTGSFGVRADNDLPGMAKRLAKHIHFIHLRNVRREQDGNFFEADHLNGETDMYAVVKALSQEQQLRAVSIPMRPDHGHEMLDDLNRVTHPGYPAIGRLRGLAELRGLEYGIVRQLSSQS